MSYRPEIVERRTDYFKESNIFIDISIILISYFLPFQALGRLGLTELERYELYSMVAAVLHLGNISFEENLEESKGGSKVCESKNSNPTTVVFGPVCVLFGVVVFRMLGTWP